MSPRRTIRETVKNGINSIPELQASLLTAIQLEFSTIPPYLCAQWSVNDSGAPGSVSYSIGNVAIQEMGHFGQVCNLYTATGASLKGEIATPDLVPVYPTVGLPGGVHPGLVVALAPLGDQALRTFMAIEYPEKGPVVPPPPDAPPPPPPPAEPTIGQFYDAISTGFETVFPTGSLPQYPAPNQVSYVDLLSAVNTVADAVNAISEITAQGEGTSASPDEGTFDPDTLAHYYTFAEIYYGRTIVEVGSGFEYSGAIIQRPAVYDFSPHQPGAPGQDEFIDTFTQLLRNLEACWTDGSDIGEQLAAMNSLQSAGTVLIKNGFAPQFTFA